MSKLFGFLLGIAVALAGPAALGVLASEGGVELTAKEMALAYGVGALVFWAVVSTFSGAAALGAALVFGAMVYAVHWIPNRMTNFLDDVPGVTSGMIEGIKQYTLNGLVPVLGVISLIYAIQLMARASQRRRQLRAEADLRQREQELAQQQESHSVSHYPVGGGDQTSVDNRYGSRYPDQYGEDPGQRSGSHAGHSGDNEQTAQYPVARGSSDRDQTAQFPTQGGSHTADDGRPEAPTDQYPTQPQGRQ